MEENGQMHILSLHSVMLEHIFSFLSYDQVAKNRIVCKDFNVICQRVLNRGFQMIEKRLSINLRTIKGQLPRRESERRFHPLSKHCDILTSIETRMSMLNMAYSRYIEQGKCCFIPGKILDELHRVLNIVDELKPLPMAFEILQELRDISGMAIEHFEDVVAPSLRQKVDEYPQRAVASKSSKLTPGNSIELTVIREISSRTNRHISRLEKKCNNLSRKVELYRKLNTLSKVRLFRNQMEQNRKINELKKKIEEYEIKFKELFVTSAYKNNNKGFEDENMINKNDALKLTLKNVSSQIKLDPSPSIIGTNRERHGSSIIKPRRAGLNPPVHQIHNSMTSNASFDILKHPIISEILNRKSDSNDVRKPTRNSSPLRKRNIYNKPCLPLKSLRKDSFDSCNKKRGESNTRKLALNSTNDLNKSTDYIIKMYKNLSENMSPSDELDCLPSTSSNVYSHDQNTEFDNTKLQKRTYNQIQPTLGIENKKVFSKSLVKLLETLLDNSHGKRRRIENNEE